MTIQLNNSTLCDLPEDIATPNYDRNSITAGILHFGVGNFHRAHQAVYLDDLFSKGLNLNWAVLGASVMSADRKSYDALSAQDYMYTLVEQSSLHSSARIIGSIKNYIQPGSHKAILSAMMNETIKIISLTITEGGYFLNSENGRFDINHPDLEHDIKYPDTPRTIFGLICAALKERRNVGITPFTVMSCDNIPQNGTVTRNTVCGLAEYIDPEFGEWIFENVSFPNSMVDRITPSTGDRERNALVEKYGVNDQCPVYCEDFSQWILEDNFSAGRPQFEKVGVQFVADVELYEKMKIRMLNGGHAMLSYPAALLEIDLVHDAMAHPLIYKFLQKVETEEVLPVVGPVSGMRSDAYLIKILERFSNPKVEDTVRRLCYDGTNRQPKFVIPTVADRLKQSASIEGLSLSCALWCRYCYGETDAGHIIEPNDEHWEKLQSVAVLSKDQPLLWIAQRHIYGDLSESAEFARAFSFWLNELWSKGVYATLGAYVGK